MKHVGGCGLQRVYILLILGIKLGWFEVVLLVGERRWLHDPLIELFDLGMIM